MEFPNTRESTLKKVNSFIPNAAAEYRSKRNYDLGPGKHKWVTGLSAAVRHRLIHEWEIVQSVLEMHTFDASEKFIQEVFWRTYWKGFLEQRPEIWQTFLNDLPELQDALADSILYEQAQAGNTGIEAFDFWVNELKETGYLHNHARMWFASIWIFTLKLPWQLGALFFLQHLIDGDPASNTLSWRWVAGLHTKGKLYQASPSNIAKFTKNRFNPSELEEHPIAIEENIDFEKQNIEELPDRIDSAKVDLIIFEEDLSPEIGSSLQDENCQVERVALANLSDITPYSELVISFKDIAFQDCRDRIKNTWNLEVATLRSENQLVKWIQESKNPIISFKPSCGFLTPVASRLERIHWLRRKWDTELYPHSKAGFFRFKKQITKICDSIDRYN